MTTVKMYNGNVEVASAENDDYDTAKNDAIMEYYRVGDHNLTWDALWDLIDDDHFDFKEIN